MFVKTKTKAMKNLLCFFFVAGCLLAHGQQNDLIVKTTLDSISCEVRSVTGLGALQGVVKYKFDNSNEIFSIQKSEVFYIVTGSRDQSSDNADWVYSVPHRPRYFNTRFDYSNTYFLKTGKAPELDDPHLKKITFSNNPAHDWKYKTGKHLKTAGGLLLGSVVLSAAGILVLYRPQIASPEAGYVLLGAGGVSLIAGYSFIIGAGHSMTRN